MGLSGRNCFTIYSLLCIPLPVTVREYGIRNTEILFNKAIAPFEGV